jgi:hypothetical protein
METNRTARHPPRRPPSPLSSSANPDLTLQTRNLCMRAYIRARIVRAPSCEHLQHRLPSRGDDLPTKQQANQSIIREHHAHPPDQNTCIFYKFFIARFPTIRPAASTQRTVRRPMSIIYLYMSPSQTSKNNHPAERHTHPPHPDQRTTKKKQSSEQPPAPCIPGARPPH